MDVDLKALFARLNAHCYAAMDAAASACVGRGGAEIGIDDLLLQFTETVDGDLALLCRHYEIAPQALRSALHQELEQIPRSGSGKPVFSSLLVNLLQDAWSLASLNYGAERLRSAHLILALKAQPRWYRLKTYADLLDRIGAEDLAANLDARLHGSVEAAPAGTPVAAPAASGDALGKYCTDFTARAREGGLDPVFCRDREIRQIIDILSRRQKNNPILVGEPGVGKSAVLEGLAQRVVAGEVPEALRDAVVLGLDLGRLQAGASVKGEFERRLTQVIQEVKAYPAPVVLFIDEAHTLIGAGGAAGGGDAANLLKPALARGELRAVAATTWSEYKKYFEKDAALARRFQLVKLDEPTVEQAVTILRGLREVYERAHGVYVRDDAVSAAAALSARYITGRQLPDKAVDVLDTACARVNIARNAKPARLEALEQEAGVLERQRAAVLRDLDQGLTTELDLPALGSRISEIEEEAAALRAQWQQAKAAVEKLLAVRARAAAGEAGPAELEAARRELAELGETAALVPHEVTPELVGEVISDWTGIPLGKLVSDEAAALLGFGERMRRWVKGQDHATAVIGERIRASKSGLGNPEAPIGVFLLVGPSGVGKTETAVATAELLFGGRQALTVINMSEFQERHTVSRLIGSPPGYVGYGEGGVLSEAVRQRPYSVVLLDEVEKADREVLNLFYQVFDKGSLNDGEGREIDFKNTVIFLTSNLATDEIMAAVEADPDIGVEALAAEIRPLLSRYFKPALLARMEVIPYFPIGAVALREIIQAKLAKLQTRLADSRGIALRYDASLTDFIARRCTLSEAGARNIDAMINRHVLPDLARDLLSSLERAEAVRALEVVVVDDRVITRVSHSPEPVAGAGIANSQ